MFTLQLMRAQNMYHYYKYYSLTGNRQAGSFNSFNLSVQLLKVGIYSAAGSIFTFTSVTARNHSSDNHSYLLMHNGFIGNNLWIWSSFMSCKFISLISSSLFAVCSLMLSSLMPTFHAALWSKHSTGETRGWFTGRLKLLLPSLNKRCWQISQCENLES